MCSKHAIIALISLLPAQTPQAPTKTLPKAGSTPSKAPAGVSRAIDRINQTFKSAGFDPALFPGKKFLRTELDPYILQAAWEEVRPAAETIIREEIGLPDEQGLWLTFVSPVGEQSLYAFVPDGGRADLGSPGTELEFAL